MELRIPVGEIEDIKEMYKVEVPENPYRVVEDTIVAEETVEEFVKDSVSGILEESVEETVENVRMFIENRCVLWYAKKIKVWE